MIALEVYFNFYYLSICCLLSYRAYSQYWNQIYEPVKSRKCLYISNMHATVVSCYYLWRCYNYYEDPLQSYKTITYPVHLFMLAWSLTYTFFDMEMLYLSGTLFKNKGAIFFHHIGMFVSLGYYILCFLFKSNDLFDEKGLDWLFTLANLAELSTPILDHLKISNYHGYPASKLLYSLFAVVYLYCRPLLLTYQLWFVAKVILGNWVILGPICLLYRDTLVFGVYLFFWALNWIWFIVMVKKFILKPQRPQ